MCYHNFHQPYQRYSEYHPNKKEIDILMDVDRHQYTHPLSPMSKKQKNPDKFRFMTEKSIRQEKFELTRWQSAQLRSKLPVGIYWVKLENGRLVQWNWTLLQNFLIDGDGPIHRALVEEYLSTLPKTN